MSLASFTNKFGRREILDASKTGRRQPVPVKSFMLKETVPLHTEIDPTKLQLQLIHPTKSNSVHTRQHDERQRISSYYYFQFKPSFCCNTSTQYTSIQFKTTQQSTYRAGRWKVEAQQLLQPPIRRQSGNTGSSRNRAGGSIAAPSYDQLETVKCELPNSLGDSLVSRKLMCKFSLSGRKSHCALYKQASPAFCPPFGWGWLLRITDGWSPRPWCGNFWRKELTWKYELAPHPKGPNNLEIAS